MLRRIGSALLLIPIIAVAIVAATILGACALAAAVWRVLTEDLTGE